MHGHGDTEGCFTVGAAVTGQKFGMPGVGETGQLCRLFVEWCGNQGLLFVG